MQQKVIIWNESQGFERPPYMILIDTAFKQSSKNESISSQASVLFHLHQNSLVWAFKYTHNCCWLDSLYNIFSYKFALFSKYEVREIYWILKSNNLMEFCKFLTASFLYSLSYRDQWDWGVDLILAESPRFYSQFWYWFFPVLGKLFKFPWCSFPACRAVPASLQLL